MAQPILDNVSVLDNFNKINTAIAELNQALIDINTVESGLAAEAIARAAADSTLQSNIDAKVEDAIVNGVTTKAPSQNIVFDQLALKQNALGYTAENAAQKGVAGGYASLDGTGKVPSAQLPSFVDDVVEAANFAALPGTGETGKIYVTLDNNKTYRWSGSAYVEISASPGSTDSVTEGSVNLYFTTARVLATVLTGLSLVTGTPITASDTALVALGKLQKQITDLGTTVGGIVSATLANIASAFHGATSKSAIVNGDEVAGMDSENGFAGTIYTWTNIKAFLKTYFDGIYQAILVSGTNIKTIDGVSILGSGNISTGGGGGTSREVISATLSGTQTNYSISGVSTSKNVTTELRVDFSGASFIWKSLNTTSWEDGKHVTVVNDTVSDSSGARFILFENQEGGSGTQFRYLFNGVPPIIMPGDFITFRLNTTDNFLDFVCSSCFGANADDSFSVYSDFVGGPAIASGAAANGLGPFVGIQGNGSCAFTSTFQASPVNAFGVLEISTHTNSTGAFFVGSSNAAMMRGGVGAALFLTRATPSTALSDGSNTYTLILGFNDAQFGAPVDAIVWKYDQASATVWRTSTISNSTETVNDQSGFTVSVSTMPYLGIFCNGDWTNIEFFYSVDGQTWVIGNAHTTNIPVGSSRTLGFGIRIQKSVGTTARLAAIDLMGVRTMHIRA